MIKRAPTKHARMLYNELLKNRINAFLEYNDGHKEVDIGIPDAHIYIEVDGPNHLNDPDQIERDFKRDHYSEIGGFRTIRISNASIENDLKRISKAIIEVIRREKEKIKKLIETE